MFKRRKLYCETPSEPFHLQSFFTSQTELVTLGQPLSLGLVSGFCSGFLLKKVGKVFVLSSGVVILLLQAAAQHDYLTINWPHIEKDFNVLVRRFQASTPGDSDPAILATSLVQQYTGITSTAFMAGLLLGLKKG